MSYLETQAEKLAEATETPYAEVLKELTETVANDKTEKAAVVMYKSKHKGRLAMGKLMEYKARVIGVSGPRNASWAGKDGEAKSGEVMNVDFMLFENGVIMSKSASFWDDRIEAGRLFTWNKCYTFKAKDSPKGLQFIKDITEVEDDDMLSVERLDWSSESATLTKIADFAGHTELFQGIVGRVIRNTAKAVIGLEIADEDSYPVTAWVRGRYDQLTPDQERVIEGISEGAEVRVYGYVNISQDGMPSIQARGVWAL